MKSYRKVPIADTGTEGMNNNTSHNFVMYLKSLLGLHKNNNGSKPAFHSVFGYYRKMLDSNNLAIEIITEMNNKLGGDIPVDVDYVKAAYLKLCDAVNVSIENFDIFTHNKYTKLHDVFNYINDHINRIISDAVMKGLPEHSNSNSVETEKSDAYYREKNILKRIAPLNLVDPLFDNFTPEACSTIHDIIRFIHVKSVSELARRSTGSLNSIPRGYSPALH